MSLFRKVQYFLKTQIQILFKNKSLSWGKNKTIKQYKTFLKEAPLYTRKSFVSASFTLEAAVILPLFACFCVSILFFFRVQQCSLCIEKAMDYSVKTVASITQKETESEAAILSKCIGLFEIRLVKENLPAKFIVGGKPGITFLGSEAANDDIKFVATYVVKLPISIFGFKAIPVRQETVSRKWIGYTEQSVVTDADVYVYVTEYGTVYHTTTACSHLDLSIKTVDGENIHLERSVSGSKYYPCEICKPKGGDGTYYYTNYGEAYHTDLSCSGLKRTIYRKRKSEVGLPACSKCGG